MNAYERLRSSEQSHRMAWQVLQEIRQVLEILDDQRIPYEVGGESLLIGLGDTW